MQSIEDAATAAKTTTSEGTRTIATRGTRAAGTGYGGERGPPANSRVRKVTWPVLKLARSESGGRSQRGETRNPILGARPTFEPHQSSGTRSDGPRHTFLPRRNATVLPPAAESRSNRVSS
jgi:hypothetical protein